MHKKTDSVERSTAKSSMKGVIKLIHLWWKAQILGMKRGHYYTVSLMNTDVHILTKTMYNKEYIITKWDLF